ncbi:MAG: hypothetical protein GY715_14200 [Planctomycetes bacterium]|nr:hypothetical protein [Planctomycetota bacterium]
MFDGLCLICTIKAAESGRRTCSGCTARYYRFRRMSARDRRRRLRRLDVELRTLHAAMHGVDRLREDVPEVQQTLTRGTDP